MIYKTNCEAKYYQSVYVHWLKNQVVKSHQTYTCFSRTLQFHCTGPQVGTTSPTFLGHGLAEFCAAFAIRYRIYPARIGQRCFFENFPGLAAMLYLVWAGPAKKVTFLPPNLTPTEFRSFTPRFLFQPIVRLRGQLGWDPFSDLGEFAI